MALLLGWGRAILLQFAHPLIAEAIADHSAFRTERWGRLQRLHGTLGAMLESTFGTDEDIARIARRINAIHDRVHGGLRAPAGSFPAGTRYSAHDPVLLRWVHATLVDSHLIAYELYVGPLSATEKDRYCAEATGMEELLGMPRGYLPKTVAELGRYLADMVASGEIAVTDAARQLAWAMLAPPSPPGARKLTMPIRLATAGLLPPAIRDSYGFRWGPRHERALLVSATLLRAFLPCMPPPVRHWPAARAALRRIRSRAA